jgi:hypothetical protein
MGSAVDVYVCYSGHSEEFKCVFDEGCVCQREETL